MKIPIALQLYSVHDACANDFLGTIAKVAAMGYDGVEFAGYHGVSAKDIRKCLDDNGLKTAGAHVTIDNFGDDKYAETLEFHHTLGCTNLVIPWLPEETRNTPEACAQTCTKLTAIVEKLQPLGLKTGFHAHQGDMAPLAGGKSAWTLLGEGTPKAFIMQYDTANGMAGGADPVQPILDLPGRGTTVHLKEWKGGHGLALIGEGDVPWSKVFDACEKVAGTQWYIVEHEFDPKNPAMDAVAKCLTNLRKMGK